MCKSVPQIAVEVRRMSTSVGASRRASSTVSISSVLSPRQTTAFIVFPSFFKQYCLSHTDSHLHDADEHPTDKSILSSKYDDGASRKRHEQRHERDVTPHEALVLHARRPTTGIGPPSQAATSVSSAWYLASSFF